MKLSSFLPQDTRSSEIISAISLITLGAFCLNSERIIFDSFFLIQLQSIYFWAMLTGLLGVMQLISVAAITKLDILRVILSWVNGTFWMWLSLSSLHINPSDIGTFFIGLTNLYAFCVNALTLRKTWET